MNRIASSALLILSFLLLASIRGQQTQKSSALYECDTNMSEIACDNKTRQDIERGIHSNPKECTFEPDWRPTNISSPTLHVTKVVGTTVEISFGREGHTIQILDYSDKACRESGGKDCSKWIPEVGKDYPATMTSEPEYMNSCLHRLLRARRDVCVGFGRITEQKYPYGVTRTSEFTACYSLPAENKSQ